MAKTLIVETTAVNLPILQRHLPPNVKFDGELTRLPRPYDDLLHVWIVLSGDGLPEWATENHGVRYGVAELLENGTLRFIPGSGMPVNQIPDCFAKECQS